MADRYGPKSVFALVDGYNLVTNKIQELRRKVTSVLERTDGLGDMWEEHTPTGQLRGEFAQEGGFFDTSAGASHGAFKDSIADNPQASGRITCFGFSGNSVGNDFDGFEGVLQMDYEILAQRGALQKANAAFQVTGRHDAGKILQVLAKKTADWNTQSDSLDYTDDPEQRAVGIASSSVANPSVITTDVPHGLADGQRALISGHSGSTPDINDEYVATVISPTTFSIPVDVTVGGTGGSLVQANSLQGGVGYLQITQLDGFTGFVGKIQNSTDDTVYTDLITFDDVTSAPTAQRKVISGTVGRYLAFQGDVTGTGSITVFCGFARF